jgi:hypothetical protein
MILVIVALAAYVAFGMIYTVRLIVGYRRTFSTVERALQKNLDGDSLKTAITSFVVTSLTWPSVMRYIARGTREALAVERMETDRALRMGV